MAATPRLNLPYIAPQQAQKHVTYNDAIRALDLLVQATAKSRTLAAPPAAPSEGDTYLVAPGASGDWAGKDQQFATWRDGGWSFRAAEEGWQVQVEDAAETVVYRGGSWAAQGGTGGNGLARFGINAEADLVNRLTVAASGSLFNHDGSGHRLALNKAASGDTASLVLQTGFSGRAEIGLAGDDELHVKVSPDGSSWAEALTVSVAGVVRLPQGRLAFPAVQLPSSDPNTLDDYAEGAWTPGLTFGGTAVGIGYAAGTGGRYTKVGRLCVATAALALSAKGTSTGNAMITGLPFTAHPGQLWACCSIGFAAALTSVTGAVLGLQQYNDTRIALYHANNGNAVALTDAHFTNISQVFLTVTYEVA